MNSPYTKHLDASLDNPHHHHTTAVTVPTYASAPVQQQPMVIQGSSNDGGSKAAIALVAIVIAIVASIAAFFAGRETGPSWNELKRYEILAGREGEVRGRDSGWSQGRKQGRTEMEFLAKYEQLRTQATAFNQGWRQGLNTGNQMGRASTRYQYGYGRGGYGRGGYGYSGYGRSRGYGYGGYYGGRGSVGGAVASAQSIANATGSPVDVIVS